MLKDLDFYDDSIDISIPISALLKKASEAIDNHNILVTLFGKKYKRLFRQIDKDKKIILCYNISRNIFYIKNISLYNNHYVNNDSVLIKDDVLYQHIFSLSKITEFVNLYFEDLQIKLVDFDNYLINIFNSKLNRSQISSYDIITSYLTISNYLELVVIDDINVVNLILNYNCSFLNKDDKCKLVSICILKFMYDYNDNNTKNLNDLFKLINKFKLKDSISNGSFKFEFDSEYSLYQCFYECYIKN